MPKANLKESMDKAIKKMETTPSLWLTCPGCYEIIYAKEVEIKNRCPRCNYIFPYPFVEARKMEALLKSGKATWGDISKLVLTALEAIKSRKRKESFLRVTYKIVLDDFQWRQVRKKIGY